MQCVIARSFAFIYARNQPNLGLLGIVLDDDSFHEAAKDNTAIEVDLDARQVRIGDRLWSFKLDDMELALVDNDGMTASYRKFGREVFEQLTTRSAGKDTTTRIELEKDTTLEPLRDLQW